VLLACLGFEEFIGGFSFVELYFFEVQDFEIGEFVEDVGTVVGGAGDGVVDEGEVLQVCEGGQAVDLTEAGQLVIGQD
jgi:hypothetical protein